MARKLMLSLVLAVLLGASLLVIYWDALTRPCLTVLVPDGAEIGIYLAPIDQSKLSDAKALIEHGKDFKGVPELRGAFDRLAPHWENGTSFRGHVVFHPNPGLYLLGSFDKAYAYLKLVSVEENTSVRFITKEDEISFMGEPVP